MHYSDPLRDTYAILSQLKEIRSADTSTLHITFSRILVFFLDFSFSTRNFKKISTLLKNDFHEI